MSTFRIVLIGPHGERDYLVRMLPNGVPCVGGADPQYAGIFPLTCAKNLQSRITRQWLNPHMACELEPVDANGMAHEIEAHPAQTEGSEL